MHMSHWCLTRRAVIPRVAAVRLAIQMSMHRSYRNVQINANIHCCTVIWFMPFSRVMQRGLHMQREGRNKSSVTVRQVSA